MAAPFRPRQRVANSGCPTPPRGLPDHPVSRPKTSRASPEDGSTRRQNRVRPRRETLMSNQNRMFEALSIIESEKADLPGRSS
jgi:hypothetical protein